MDGAAPHWSEPHKGYRISIVAFYHNYEKDLSVVERARLVKLGYRTHLTEGLESLVTSPQVDTGKTT